MASVYLRGSLWWARVKDTGGEWCSKPTGLTDRAEALAFARALDGKASPPDPVASRLGAAVEAQRALWRERAARSRAKNPERDRETRKAWRAANPEKAKAQRERAKPRERRRERRRDALRWRTDPVRRQRKREAYERFYQANLEDQRRQGRERVARSRARRAAAITADDWQRIADVVKKARKR